MQKTQLKRRRRNSFSKIARQLNCLDHTGHTTTSDSLYSGTSQRSLYGYECDATELLNELNQDIHQLNETKNALDQIIESSLELAISRHSYGSSNNGSLLCLRKMKSVV